MTVIVCGRGDILADTCPRCGGWLHAVRRGGFPGPHGWQYCDEDCAAEQAERDLQQQVEIHLNVRDLLCGCAEVCAPLGLPTQEMRNEYATYQASVAGQNWCGFCGPGDHDTANCTSKELG